MTCLDRKFAFERFRPSVHVQESLAVAGGYHPPATLDAQVLQYGSDADNETCKRYMSTSATMTVSECVRAMIVLFEKQCF